MKNVNINNLSEDAKNLVKLYFSNSFLEKRIYMTSTNCIIDDIEFKHVKNMELILDELKQNGNIKSYERIFVDEQKIMFIFKCD